MTGFVIISKKKTPSVLSILFNFQSSRPRRGAHAHARERERERMAWKQPDHFRGGVEWGTSAQDLFPSSAVAGRGMDMSMAMPPPPPGVGRPDFSGLPVPPTSLGDMPMFPAGDNIRALIQSKVNLSSELSALTYPVSSLHPLLLHFFFCEYGFYFCV
jgi:hypothetical protein